MRRQLGMLVVLVALLGGFGRGYAVAAEESLYCNVWAGEVCITDYCAEIVTPGWDCRYQGSDCECVPVHD